MTVPSCRLFLGDSMEVLQTLDAESIDSVVCDPPYELGFMGKSWDSAGVSYRPETWEAILRVLKPGGHLLAFGGTRTYHRMAVAIEDSGFEVRDSLHWIYGSGFPKSLDVSKAIDKALGAERTEVVGHKDSGLDKGSGNSVDFSESVGRDETGLIPVTLPATATATATAWHGWGTALKPAHEPILLGRKRLAGTVAESVMTHGTGALNVRGCEVGVDGGTRQVTPKGKPSGYEATSYGASIGSAPGGNEPSGGRWPSNVLLGHLPDCEGGSAAHTATLCAPGCPVAELNATDDGEGAARFFYVAKPRKRERVGGTVRNLHPTVKPIDLMRYLVRLVTVRGGVVLDPFLGSGSTGCAAMAEGLRFVGIEMEEASYKTALERISDYAFAHGRERPVGVNLTS